MEVVLVGTSGSCSSSGGCICSGTSSCSCGGGSSSVSMVRFSSCVLVIVM